MTKHSLIRTIYLYLFALLGLVLLTIGGVRFVDMGLKAFVFTKAEEDERLRDKMLPSLVYPIKRVEEIQDNEELSDEERTTITQWLEDYKEWQKRSSEINYVTVRRHKDASFNLSLILIGLPLYLYHWIIIKKEIKNKAKAQQTA